MFRNTYQNGFLSILYSIGSQPLTIWGRCVQNGHIKRLSDDDVKSQIIEITGTNVATTYIFCPEDKKLSLGVKLKFLVLIVKNLNKFFSFEITILDDTNIRRRLRASNYQSTTRVRPFSCSMPMGLNPGWNQVQFNLADFTRRAYGTQYVETTRIQIHANCRLRRVYFTDKLYSEDDVPPEYRLYVNDDPRKRRFSEPATAMTSAGLTAAALAAQAVLACGPPIAPPPPCGGDMRISRDERSSTDEHAERDADGDLLPRGEKSLPSWTRTPQLDKSFASMTQSQKSASVIQPPPGSPVENETEGPVSGSVVPSAELVSKTGSAAPAGETLKTGSVTPPPSGSKTGSEAQPTISKTGSINQFSSAPMSQASPLRTPPAASKTTSITQPTPGSQVVSLTQSYQAGTIPGSLTQAPPLGSKGGSLTQSNQAGTVPGSLTQAPSLGPKEGSFTQAAE